MIIQFHEVERVENLMYEGCESHWHCIHCNDYWPFHCYGRKDLEQMPCPVRSAQAQKGMTKKEVKEALDGIRDMSDEEIACNGSFIRRTAEEAFALIKKS